MTKSDVTNSYVYLWLFILQFFQLVSALYNLQEKHFNKENCD